MRKTVLFLFILGMVLGGCGQKAKNPRISEDDEAAFGNEQKVMSFSLSGYEKNGKKKWEIEGKSADIIAEIVNLSNVVANAYGEEVDVKLVADKGVFNRKTNDVCFEENVVVTSSDGTRLTTDVLEWKNDEGKVYTAKPVRITHGNDRAASAAEEIIACSNEDGAGTDAGLLSVNSPTTITCDGPMEVDYAKNYAEFKNNVKVEDEKGLLYCDIATAYYDTQTRQLTKIVAAGHVKIVRGDSQTFSDEAVYLAKEHKVILKGSPRVVIYPEEDGSQKEKM